MSAELGAPVVSEPSTPLQRPAAAVSIVQEEYDVEYMLRPPSEYASLTDDEDEFFSADEEEEG